MKRLIGNKRFVVASAGILLASATLTMINTGTSSAQGLNTGINGHGDIVRGDLDRDHLPPGPIPTSSQPTAGCKSNCNPTGPKYTYVYKPVTGAYVDCWPNVVTEFKDGVFNREYMVCVPMNAATPTAPALPPPNVPLLLAKAEEIKLVKPTIVSDFKSKILVKSDATFKVVIPGKISRTVDATYNAELSASVTSVVVNYGDGTPVQTVNAGPGQTVNLKHTFTKTGHVEVTVSLRWRGLLTGNGFADQVTDTLDPTVSVDPHDVVGIWAVPYT